MASPYGTSPTEARGSDSQVTVDTNDRLYSRQNHGRLKIVSAKHTPERRKMFLVTTQKTSVARRLAGEAARELTANGENLTT